MHRYHVEHRDDGSTWYRIVDVDTGISYAVGFVDWPGGLPRLRVAARRRRAVWGRLRTRVADHVDAYRLAVGAAKLSGSAYARFVGGPAGTHERSLPADPSGVPPLEWVVDELSSASWYAAPYGPEVVYDRRVYRRGRWCGPDGVWEYRSRGRL